jgi:hypothetical protein
MKESSKLRSNKAALFGFIVFTLMFLIMPSIVHGGFLDFLEFYNTTNVKGRIFTAAWFLVSLLAGVGTWDIRRL